MEMLTLQNDVLTANLAYYLQTYSPETFVMPDFKLAAVLVLLVQTARGWHVLFTVRSQALPNHAGQIAFPGGKVEANESLERAALRECYEEIGLTLPTQAVLGYLGDQLSPFGYVVTPLVAACQADDLATFLTTLKCNDGEVDEIFCVPLAELLTICPRYETRNFKGMERTLHYYEWSTRLIWGLTGNVLAELLEVVEHVYKFPRDLGVS
jgi:8-oxo-dGTP pyrophosphatase MutT (NUDIX family)